MAVSEQSAESPLILVVEDDVALARTVRQVLSASDSAVWLADSGAGARAVLGTWEGWLAFVAVGPAIVRRTGHVSTHGSREDLAYPASGLQAASLKAGRARPARACQPLPPVAGSPRPWSEHARNANADGQAHGELTGA